MSEERIGTPEELAALQALRDDGDAKYLAINGRFPRADEIGWRKWRTPVDFRVVGHISDRPPKDDQDERPDGRGDG